MLDLDYDGSAQINPDDNLFSAPVIEDTRYRPPSIAGKNDPGGTATCRFGQPAALNSLTGLSYISQMPASHSYDYHARVQPQAPVYQPSRQPHALPYNTPVTLTPSYVQIPTPGTSNPGSMSMVQNWAPVAAPPPPVKEHFTAGASAPPAKGGLTINMTLMDTILFIMFIIVMVMMSFVFGMHVGKKGRKDAAEKSGKYLVVQAVPTPAHL